MTNALTRLAFATVLSLCCGPVLAQNWQVCGAPGVGACAGKIVCGPALGNVLCGSPFAQVNCCFPTQQAACAWMRSNCCTITGGCGGSELNPVDRSTFTALRNPLGRGSPPHDQQRLVDQDSSPAE
jgi:hypothetical protein